MDRREVLRRFYNGNLAAAVKKDCWQNRFLRFAALLYGGVLAVLFAGCTSSQHRRAADKEVYQIISQAEADVFGKTNAFSIDTPYSGREPKEVLPSELIESRLQTNRRVLTIHDALRLGATQSRRYQTEKERLYLTALTLTGERYEFGPQFFARSESAFVRFKNSDDASTERRLSVGSDVGVSQMLRTGGKISVGLANDILRYYTGDPRRSVVSAITINLSQPLLRGFGRNNAAVEALTQAERNVIYAVRNFGYFQQEFSVEIVNDYFDLLAQKDIVRNRYTNYLSRVKATQRLEARARDREQIASVDQARQAELTARNNYVNAAATYQNAVNSFKIKLGLALGEQVTLDDSALAELERTGLIPVPLDALPAFRTAVDTQLLILNSIDRFEDIKRKIRVAADALKPGLDLFADASLGSEESTDYTRFDANKIRAGVGLKLDLPIDRLRERNNYRATLVTFESEIRNLTLALDALKDNIEQGLRTLEQRRQNYEIQRLALELANRRVESTTLLLEAGRAEVRDLVEAQDAQINAQNAVTAAIVSYQQIRLQIMLDIGALDTSVEKFWLKDHLANWQKAQPASRPLDQQAVVRPPDEFFTN